MLGIHYDDSKREKVADELNASNKPPHIPSRKSDFRNNQIKPKAVNFFNWRQLAEDRCLTPAHELARLKARDTITSFESTTIPKKKKDRDKKVKFNVEVSNRLIGEGQGESVELGSDLCILWKQSPLSLPILSGGEPLSEMATAEVVHTLILLFMVIVLPN